MADNPYLSLIANLNSESPVISSPDDYSADLSLWTNAEFTFDMPPGLGIFEQDSGFEALSALNHPSAQGLADLPSTTTASSASPELATKPASRVVGHNPQSALDQQHLMEYLNLPQEESRPLSLLERTRQRNPASTENGQSLPELQEQAAAINAFHSLLAAYTASVQAQQQQQLQQPQSVQQQQQAQRSSGLPLLLPNIAPATAPTTPAAAKLLRQPVPQYKAATPIAKKQNKAQTPPASVSTAALVTLAPKSPTTANANAIASVATTSSSPVTSLSEEKDSEADKTSVKLESSTASLSKDDPEDQKLAAEEDKRRRNTAASARFRYKKKLREQALEQTAKEQTLRAETLEARVKELEMEVKWLRGLIVEKDSRLHEVSASLDEQASKRVKLDVY
ncbi:MAG: hypothetical protein J3Q66DRAFT_325097 [Benniella sp.]|nr:MAG: hypothetical protein J3Q66DRAFT_325097 [Benniella sp.]